MKSIKILLLTVSFLILSVFLIGCQHELIQRTTPDISEHSLKQEITLTLHAENEYTVMIFFVWRRFYV